MRKLLVLLCMVPCMASAAASNASSNAAASNASSNAASTVKANGQSIFPSSSSDWAAWIQAFGSIFAIIAAASIAGWQARQAAIQLQRQKALQDDERMKTFNEIVYAALMLQRKLVDRLDSIHAIAVAVDEKETFMPEVLALERALDRVELHLLPSDLVRPAITVASTFTQFRILLEIHLKDSRLMVGSRFNDFRSELEAMYDDLHMTYRYMKILLKAIQTSGVSRYVLDETDHEEISTPSP